MKIQHGPGLAQQAVPFVAIEPENSEYFQSLVAQLVDDQFSALVHGAVKNQIVFGLLCRRDSLQHVDMVEINQPRFLMADHLQIGIRVIPDKMTVKTGLVL